MAAYSLYAQMRGLPPPEPWPVPVTPTAEEEAEYEAIRAELEAEFVSDLLGTHYRTAVEAREQIAKQLIPVAYSLAWQSHRRCRAIDVDDMAGDMLLALAKWLLNNINDNSPLQIWGWQHRGGFEIQKHGGTILRKALDVMLKARAAHFKRLPEREDPYLHRILRRERGEPKRRARTVLRVRATLAELPRRERQLLKMHMEGRTIREMAEKIGEAKSTVDRCLRQAKEKFRENFAAKWDKTKTAGS